MSNPIWDGLSLAADNYFTPVLQRVDPFITVEAERSLSLARNRRWKVGLTLQTEFEYPDGTVPPVDVTEVCKRRLNGHVFGGFREPLHDLRRDLYALQQDLAYDKKAFDAINTLHNKVNSLYESMFPR